MACMVDFAVLFVESLLILVPRVLFYCLYLRVHAVRYVTHVLLCYFSCFTPQCTSSGPSLDWLPMYCYVTLVVVKLSTYPVEPDLFTTCYYS